MRIAFGPAAAIVVTLAAIPAARACEPVVAGCLPEVVVYPAYTATGLPLGEVEARLRRPPVLEVSRFTGQPLTVITSNPGRFRDSVDPDVVLVPLPRVPRNRTQAVYPTGY